MKEIIATVRLAPGNVGYYDPITGIHLTITSADREIYRGMNTANLRRSVKMGVLQLVHGSLVEPEKPVEIKAEPTVVAPVVQEVEQPIAVKKEEQIAEEIPVPAAIAVEEVQAIAEEALPEKATEEQLHVEEIVIEETAAEEIVTEEGAEEAKSRKGRKR